MSNIESDNWLDILQKVIEDKATFVIWFLEQVRQKQIELGKETVNLTASAIIVAREMGYDVSKW